MNSVTSASRSVVQIKCGSTLKQRELDKRLTEAFSRVPNSSAMDLRVILDWSEVQFADLATLIWCLVFLDQLKSQGCDLALKLPDPNPVGSSGHRFWSFLIRWRFFDALQCVDHPANLLPDDQVDWLDMAPKYQISHRPDQDGNIQQAQTLRLLEICSFRLKLGPTVHSEEFRRAFDPYVELWKKIVIIRALSNWCQWSEQDAHKFVAKTVVEFLENARDHSGGAWVLSGFNVDNKNLMLSVGDNGSGIPDTLRTALSQNKARKDQVEQMSDADLIRYFTAPKMILDSELIRVSTKGVIPTPEGRPGRGLYYCKQMILDNGGELRIRSGSACVEFLPNGKERPTDGLYKCMGTTIRVTIPRKA